MPYRRECACEALQLGDCVVVLKRPAKIACDVKISPDLGVADKEAIRAQILAVLTA